MVLSILAGTFPLQQPTFRARTELVRIDALVTDDGAPVAGLTASDFEVRDNGIRQRVTAAGTVEAVQLGVVLDVSGSMTGEPPRDRARRDLELAGSVDARRSVRDCRLRRSDRARRQARRVGGRRHDGVGYDSGRRRDGDG